MVMAMVMTVWPRADPFPEYQLTSGSGPCFLIAAQLKLNFRTVREYLDIDSATF
jgi:hypothetical protein